MGLRRTNDDGNQHHGSRGRSGVDDHGVFPCSHLRERDGFAQTSARRAIILGALYLQLSQLIDFAS